MNAERRKKLADIAERIDALRDELVEVIDAEREAFDNMPEAFRDGDKGQDVEEKINELEEADESLSTAVYTLNEMAGA